MAEREAELIAAAFEEAIADEAIPYEQRARIVARFAARLSRLEGNTIDDVEMEATPSG